MATPSSAAQAVAGSRPKHIAIARNALSPRCRIICFLLIPFSSFSVSVFLLGHGKQLVMAHLHIAEADKNAVCHRAVPHLRVGK